MNRKISKIVTIALLSLILICVVLLAVGSRFGHLTIMLPLKHKAEFVNGNVASFPSKLQVSGNQIVNAEGSVVLLKGLMPPDPARLHSENKFSRDFFSGMRETGANVIRIPVHPENWVNDKDYLWRYLDPIITWAGESNVYVIIDWHYIGNIATGAGPEMPDIADKPKDLTLEFWQLTARYFREVPNVIFEIYNEPQSIGAEEWRSNAVEIVQAIREQGASQLVIVGGIDYGKDLSWVIKHPIDDENISYASHIYPVHSSSQWNYLFGTVAEKYPVLITEWGFMDENRNTAQSYLAGDGATYGEPFLEYLNARDIGWVACWYDDKWEPAMFTESWKGYTRYGEFVMQQLKKLTHLAAQHSVPGNHRHFASDPWKSTKDRLVGLAAFSGRFLASSWFRQRGVISPPTHQWVPRKVRGQAAHRYKYIERKNRS
jgi:endoglucanase